MITAKNYAAQAEWGLRKYAEYYKHKQDSADHRSVLRMADVIKMSQHFVVEDGGMMFDDMLKGLKGMEARLPYPSITIEYWSKKSRLAHQNGQGAFQKTVVLAQEISTEEVYEKIGVDYRSKNTHAIQVTYTEYAEELKIWVPAIGMMIVPSSWDDGDLTDGEIIEHPSRPYDKNGVNIVGTSLPFMTDTCHELDKQYGAEEVRTTMGLDCVNEVRVVLELCEALTCSNVQISDYSPPGSKVRKLIKSKFPQYETKCLTIDTARPSLVVAGSHSPSDRNSPRQHLRRGHIRRLPEKNVWVNSCVVGDPAIGKIDKSYKVKA